MKRMFGVILIVFVFLFLGGSVLSALGAMVKKEETPPQDVVVNSDRQITFEITGTTHTTTSGKKWSQLAQELDGISVAESGKVMKGTSYLVTSAGYAVLFTDTVAEGEKYELCGHKWINKANVTSLSNAVHRLTNSCTVCGYEKHVDQGHNYLNSVCQDCDHTCTCWCDECNDYALLCQHATVKGKCYFCGVSAAG